MTKPISEETRRAVLDAAWDLMARQRRLDAGMAEVAAAAGVSRQTLFYAFGNRAGLLVAMARHRDTKGGGVDRMRAVAAGAGDDAATLHAFIDAWLAYLPEVYPVAIQLETSSLSDADAAAAWHDRIFGQGVHLGLQTILERMAARGTLAPAHDALRVADLCLTLLVPSAWRYLVVERGWSAQAFAASRHALVQAILDAPSGISRADVPARRPAATSRRGR